MNIIRQSLLLSLLGVSAGAFALPAGDWKIHPTFDQNVLRVIDTPQRTYFQSLAQDVKSGVDPFVNQYPFLFMYDKEADELLPLSRRNMLTENIVSFVSYNPDKKYLLAVYDNGNIDLLFDDDRRVNIPGLVSVNFSTGKGVNGATFDGDRVWLATDFGYLVLDDEQGQIKSSVVLNEKVFSVARVGDKVLVARSGGLYSIPADEKFPSAASMTKVNGPMNPRQILPLEGDSERFYSMDSNGKVGLYTFNASGAAMGTLKAEKFTSATRNKNGYLLSGDAVATIGADGTYTVVSVDAADAKVPCGSWDGREFFFAKNRAGLYSKKLDEQTWTLTRDVISPNAPGVFRCYTSMAYNPRHGFVVSDHGISRTIYSYAYRYPSHLSTYKEGEWSRVAPIYADAKYQEALLQPNGLAVDPDNPDYVYSGSYFRGLVRFNVNDPDDIIRFVSKSDNLNLGTKHIVLPSHPSMATYMDASTPRFDGSGNLWFAYPHSFATLDGDGKEPGHMLVWAADKRKAAMASGDPANANYGPDAWTRIPINLPDWKTDYDMMITPLTSSANNGLVMVSPGPWGGDIVVYDCNRTPSDTSDDKIARMTSTVDQDGNSHSANHVYDFYEDPSTGLVWVLGDNGIYTVNPRQTFTNSHRINRIKVARNDGTNLADYLLNGVTVYSMTADAAGRKYFGTAGGGIVITSADGREILGQLTTDNSYLPDNTVYNLCYSPASNSLLVSTASGLAEYFPAGSSTGDSFDSVSIYPNPVRPDYYGWVTVEGVVDGSMVKIVDAAGNLVKELGFASGGAVRWDATNVSGKRVTSGVYFVLMSTTGEGAKEANIGKVLVVN